MDNVFQMSLMCWGSTRCLWHVTELRCLLFSCVDRVLIFFLSVCVSASCYSRKGHIIFIIIFDNQLTRTIMICCCFVGTGFASHNAVFDRASRASRNRFAPVSSRSSFDRWIAANKSNNRTAHVLCNSLQSDDWLWQCTCNVLALLRQSLWSLLK